MRERGGRGFAKKKDQKKRLAVLPSPKRKK